MPSNKTWLQLICTASKKHHELIEAEMEGAGALSITWNDAKDDPVLEPLPGETPLWDNLIITALFESDTDLNPLSQTLTSHKTSWDIQNLQTEVIKDQDWERVWMEDFHPMRFGENLWIVPSNYDISDVAEIQNVTNPTTILLDPGLAFGTGTHPTTALCLEWLDQNPPKDLTAIDFGCGSGILAVAAIKLGSSEVLATDIDPQALVATKENMSRNKISADKIPCYLPADLPDTPVDLVLANILCGPLIELSSQLSSLVKSGGRIIISGLLEKQKDEIISAYSTNFTNFEVKQLEDWIRISATKV